MPENVSVGVVDAGIALTRLDRRRRSHTDVVALLERCARGLIELHVSIVNVAEVLEHAQRYVEATGVDPVAVLRAYRITIQTPDLDVARRVARLASARDASLADRFAVATAQVLGARLHTTDAPLAGIAKRLRLPVTLY